MIALLTLGAFLV